jgi:hypothetical protein
VGQKGFWSKIAPKMRRAFREDAWIRSLARR